MRYAYYPGCSLHSTGVEYDKSLRAVAPHFGLEIDEPEGWVCCGTSSAHATSRSLAAALPLHNLNLVAQSGHAEVLVPCAACFARFKHALHEVREHPAAAAEVERVMGGKPATSVKPVHPLEVLDSLAQREEFRKSVVRDLSGLKVACYYGCLLTRPADVMRFDNCEYPMSMDRIVAACGANPVDWSFKTECCGASFSLTKTELVHDLTAKVLSDAKARGANCIAVACSLCHANLDARQPEIEKKTGKKFGLPVLYFTQILGLALGLPFKDIALHKHIVPPLGLVAGLRETASAPRLLPAPPGA
ncbi:MAG: CoB--CoM heterodisulfide reductase iron-sulfur subunit B family protein [Deltaproteobacteria bacterium]|nr:CoB--CoM heterodisulfide reductase iron-sulfur subunit B family protein [Deltaproteobacteria bacterium]